MPETAVSYDQLRREIAAKHPELSNRLRQIARFALSHPNDMALETVTVIASRAGVQPSSLIRFAGVFGYQGFSEMQRIFRSRLAERSLSYAERIKDLTKDGGGDLETPAQVLDHLAAASIHALEHLRAEVRADALDRAVAVLADAEIIHVMAQRRAFPVAAYFGYSLSHLERRINLIDSIGGMVEQQARCMAPGDVLLAVSFEPYAPDTVAVARAAADRGIPIVAITDHALSPLIPLARVSFEIEDAQIKTFRSLSAIMCLAVTLVVSLGQRLGRRDAA